MNKEIAVGVLAYNVESYIEKVVKELSTLGLKIYIINDKSRDKTSEILKSLSKDKKIEIINNEKNLGAGKSLKKLIKKIKEDGFNFILKVDGDGQFIIKDIEKIITLYKESDYKFIKSNRFWDGGIQGSIPKKRFIGNLIATILMQVVTGTNKLHDPLNGLFGISVDIENYLNSKNYPNRYGYPYFFTIAAVINNFKTHQINNVVIYEDQKSNLNSFFVFFTLLKLSIVFYFSKLRMKKNIAIYQRSAFFDFAFIFTSLLVLIEFSYLIFIAFYAEQTIVRPSTLLIILISSLFVMIWFFIQSFKEEKEIRNLNITSDK
tara:strand:+ start:55477 stop:56433 length:957 start_codon:yes stop_codon:yes gene_type:complete